MNTVSQSPSQPTDLMRRRVSLDLKATFIWRGITLQIATNSSAILQAATDAGLKTMQDADVESGLCWEVTVEDDAAISRPACAPHLWRNGCSIYIEIAQHQWFALDAESGDGAGFLATRAPDLDARVYLESILRILEPELQHQSSVTGCNG
jgi:hypothetical protein